MTRERRAAGEVDGSALVGQVEGYLLLQAEREQARREAQDLCDRLPWLTSTQAEDLTDRYCEQRLLVTRRMLQAVVTRADELRDAYEARYAALRRTLVKRHAACAALLLACAGVVSTGFCLLAR